MRFISRSRECRATFVRSHPGDGVSMATCNKAFKRQHVRTGNLFRGSSILSNPLTCSGLSMPLERLFEGIGSLTVEPAGLQTEPCGLLGQRGIGLEKVGKVLLQRFEVKLDRFDVAPYDRA